MKTALPLKVRREIVNTLHSTTAAPPRDCARAAMHFEFDFDRALAYLSVPAFIRQPLPPLPPLNREPPCA